MPCARKTAVITEKRILTLNLAGHYLGYLCVALRSELGARNLVKP
jgi:hypothetical protein